MSHKRDFDALLNDHDYGWVAADLANPHAGHGYPPPETDREYYDQIIHTIDHSQAPGSETALLTDALAADGFEDDPIGCLRYWITAYLAWGRAANHPDSTKDLVLDDIFDGNPDRALSRVTP